MTKFHDNKSPYLTLLETTAPATPDAGEVRLFRDEADNRLKIKDSGGVVRGLQGSWADANMTLKVNDVAIALHEDSRQRYKIIDGNVCVVQAVLSGAAGENQNGYIEITDLPVEPSAGYITPWSIIGDGEELDNGNNLFQTRFFIYSLTSPAVLRCRRYDTYLSSSWNFVGNADLSLADAIILNLLYEVDE